MNVIWIGHSCFKIESEGYTLIIDPYKSVPGLKTVNEKANCVICTHEHSDHNARENIELEESGFSSIKIEKIESFHDNKQGKLRGKNNIYIIEDGTFKLVHMGDIGCELKESQYSILKDADVLCIPIGGTYTIDGQKAKQYIAELKPKIAIPMHYRDDDLGIGFKNLSTLETFKHVIGDIEVVDKCYIELNNSAKSFKKKAFKLFNLKKNEKTKVIILKPQNSNII